MISNPKRKIGIFLLCLATVLLFQGSAFCFDKRFSSTLSRYIVAGMYEKLGDIERAIVEYKKALKLDYQNASIHLGLAGAYLKKREIPKAIEELNLTAKFAPEAVEPHAILALLYFSQEKITEAGQEYQRALEKAAALEPKNTAVYKQLGILYLQQKNYPAAEKTFKLIIAISGADAEAHFYLGNIYDEQKNRALAMQELQKALESNPDYHQALNYLGYLYVEENKNLDKAEAMIKKALEFQPKNGAYIDSLGWLYFKQGKLKEALKELEKAAGLLEDPVIYDHLADAYFKNRDFEKAKLNWEKSLKLEPGQETVQKKIEGLNK